MARGNVMFIFVRLAVVFCTVAFLLALCTDVLQFLTLMIWTHISGSGVGFLAKRGQWLVIFAVWWAASFLIAIPFARKFGGLPFRLF